MLLGYPVVNASGAPLGFPLGMGCSVRVSAPPPPPDIRDCPPWLHSDTYFIIDIVVTVTAE